jgi:hypothetical protein
MKDYRVTRQLRNGTLHVFRIRAGSAAAAAQFADDAKWEADGRPAPPREDRIPGGRGR